jgi:hypothetical protein
MPYFMVFEIWQRGEVKKGELKTAAGAVAAFHADTGEEACQAAARATKRLTTYFAVEGTPWGVEMIGVAGTSEIGADLDEETVAERRLRELERRVLDRDVPLS